MYWNERIRNKERNNSCETPSFLYSRELTDETKEAIRNTVEKIITFKKKAYIYDAIMNKIHEALRVQLPMEEELYKNKADWGLRMPDFTITCPDDALFNAFFPCEPGQKLNVHFFSISTHGIDLGFSDTAKVFSFDNLEDAYVLYVLNKLTNFVDLLKKRARSRDPLYKLAVDRLAKNIEAVGEIVKAVDEAAGKTPVSFRKPSLDAFKNIDIDYITQAVIDDFESIKQAIINNESHRTLEYLSRLITAGPMKVLAIDRTPRIIQEINAIPDLSWLDPYLRDFIRSKFLYDLKKSEKDTKWLVHAQYWLERYGYLKDAALEYNPYFLNQKIERVVLNNDGTIHVYYFNYEGVRDMYKLTLNEIKDIDFLALMVLDKSFNTLDYFINETEKRIEREEKEALPRAMAIGSMARLLFK